MGPTSMCYPGVWQPGQVLISKSRTWQRRRGGIPHEWVCAISVEVQACCTAENLTSMRSYSSQCGTRRRRWPWLCTWREECLPAA